MSRELTTTSYAVLGLLAIKPWTTYELAKQMDRSLKHYWPRAASRIYEEPKRLVALGLAEATAGSVGKRPRTTYSITAQGREILARWLAEPGAGPVVEFEAMLKVFFAEHATTDDVMANIDAIRSWAARQNAENVAFARLYTEQGGPFPERLAAITLTGRFMTDLADMLERWAQWAGGVVGAWPDDPATAQPDWETLRAIAGRRVTPAELPGE
ncbi:PadR family transcriptional regulator [Lentzea atacamensis]|uniref:PadR family transcriptional regulator n=2 Tax=Lentzea atacamensis TaxID=531938 RepID=A0ABX9E4P8_9PSEU|nr:PadR family transcriptional regulator [Lentzea atacamensis]